MTRQWIPAIAMIAGVAFTAMPAGAQDALVVTKSLSPELALEAPRPRSPNAASRAFRSRSRWSIAPDCSR